ncbi:hypothetical protein ACWGN9_17395 [Streptomyces sp. NPDC055775]
MSDAVEWATAVECYLTSLTADTPPDRDTATAAAPVAVVVARQAIIHAHAVAPEKSLAVRQIALLTEAIGGDDPDGVGALLDFWYFAWTGQFAIGTFLGDETLPHQLKVSLQAVVSAGGRPALQAARGGLLREAGRRLESELRAAAAANHVMGKDLFLRPYQDFVERGPDACLLLAKSPTDAVRAVNTSLLKPLTMGGARYQQTVETVAGIAERMREVLDLTNTVRQAPPPAPLRPARDDIAQLPAAARALLPAVLLDLVAGDDGLFDVPFDAEPVLEQMEEQLSLLETAEALRPALVLGENGRRGGVATEVQTHLVSIRSRLDGVARHIAESPELTEFLEEVRAEVAEGVTGQVDTFLDLARPLVARGRRLERIAALREKITEASADVDDENTTGEHAARARLAAVLDTAERTKDEEAADQLLAMAEEMAQRVSQRAGVLTGSDRARDVTVEPSGDPMSVPAILLLAELLEEPWHPLLPQALRSVADAEAAASAFEELASRAAGPVQRAAAVCAMGWSVSAGDPRRALEQHARLAERASRSATRHWNEGCARAALGDLHGAVTAFEAVARLGDSPPHLVVQPVMDVFREAGRPCPFRPPQRFGPVPDARVDAVVTQRFEVTAKRLRLNGRTAEAELLLEALTEVWAAAPGRSLLMKIYREEHRLADAERFVARMASRNAVDWMLDFDLALVAAESGDRHRARELRDGLVSRAPEQHLLQLERRLTPGRNALGLPALPHQATTEPDTGPAPFSPTPGIRLDDDGLPPLLLHEGLLPPDADGLPDGLLRALKRIDSPGEAAQAFADWAGEAQGRAARTAAACAVGWACRAGDAESAMAWATSLLPDDVEGWPLWNRACAQELAGDTAGAARTLLKAHETGDQPPPSVWPLFAERLTAAGLPVPPSPHSGSPGPRPPARITSATVQHFESLAKRLYTVGRPRDAEWLLRALVEAAPRTPGRLLLMKIWREGRRLDDALALVSQRRALGEDDWRLCYEAGLVAVATGRPQVALDMRRQVVELDGPADWIAQLDRRIGVTHAPPPSQTYYGARTVLAPEQLIVQRTLNGRQDKAALLEPARQLLDEQGPVALLTIARQLERTAPWARLTLLDLLIDRVAEQPDRQAPVGLVEQVVASDDAKLVERLATALDDSGDHPEAVRLLAGFAERCRPTQRPRIWHRIARLLRGHGETEEAARIAARTTPPLPLQPLQPAPDQAVPLVPRHSHLVLPPRPHDGPALLHEAQELEQCHGPEAAADAWRAALEAGHVLAYPNTLGILVAAHRAEEALDLYRRNADRFWTGSAAAWNIAAAYAQLGLLEQAADSLEIEARISSRTVLGPEDRVAVDEIFRLVGRPSPRGRHTPVGVTVLTGAVRTPAPSETLATGVSPGRETASAASAPDTCRTDSLGQEAAGLGAAGSGVPSAAGTDLLHPSALVRSSSSAGDSTSGTPAAGDLATGTPDRASADRGAADLAGPDTGDVAAEASALRAVVMPAPRPAPAAETAPRSTAEHSLQPAPPAVGDMPPPRVKPEDWENRHHADTFRNALRAEGLDSLRFRQNTLAIRAQSNRLVEGLAGEAARFVNPAPRMLLPEQLSRINPTAATAFTDGMSAAREGDWQQAAEAWRTAYDVHPRNEVIAADLLLALVRTGEHDLARTLADGFGFSTSFIRPRAALAHALGGPTAAIEEIALMREEDLGLGRTELPLAQAGLEYHHVQDRYAVARILLAVANDRPPGLARMFAVVALLLGEETGDDTLVDEASRCLLRSTQHVNDIVSDALRDRRPDHLTLVRGLLGTAHLKRIAEARATERARENPSHRRLTVMRSLLEQRRTVSPEARWLWARMLGEDGENAEAARAYAEVVQELSVAAGRPGLARAVEEWIQAARSSGDPSRHREALAAKQDLGLPMRTRELELLRGDEVAQEGRLLDLDSDLVSFEAADVVNARPEAMYRLERVVESVRSVAAGSHDEVTVDRLADVWSQQLHQEVSTEEGRARLMVLRRRAKELTTHVGDPALRDAAQRVSVVTYRLWEESGRRLLPARVQAAFRITESELWCYDDGPLHVRITVEPLEDEGHVQIGWNGFLPGEVELHRGRAQQVVFRVDQVYEVDRVDLDFWIYRPGAAEPENEKILYPVECRSWCETLADHAFDAGSPASARIRVPREAELTLLRGHYRNRTAAPVRFLHGPRQVGKTTLARSLSAHPLPENPAEWPLPGVLAVDVNGETWSHTHNVSLWKWLAELIGQGVGKAWPAGVSWNRPEPANGYEFGHWLTGMRLEGLDAWCLLLMIDEFQTLLDRVHEAGMPIAHLGDQLRGMASDPDTPFLLLTLGSCSFESLKTRLVPHGSNLTDEIREFPVGFMEPAQARQIFERGFDDGVLLQPGVVEAVVAYTGGYPYHVHCMGEELAKLLAHRKASVITLEDVEAAAQALIERPEVSKPFSDMEREPGVAEAVAHLLENPADSDEHIIDGDAVDMAVDPEVDRGLDRIKELGLIRREGHNWAWSNLLIHHWLKERHARQQFKARARAAVQPAPAAAPRPAVHGPDTGQDPADALHRAGFEVGEPLGEQRADGFPSVRKVGIQGRIAVAKLFDVEAGESVLAELGARFERLEQTVGPSAPRLLPERQVVDGRWFVFEWTEGRTLAEVIRDAERQPYTWQDAVRWITDAAAVVGRAYLDGALTHGDVKPANLVLAAPDGRMTVIDWGGGNLDGKASPIFRDHALDPRYAPAEALFEYGDDSEPRGAQPSDDAYCLAATLFELVHPQRQRLSDILGEDTDAHFYLIEDASSIMLAPMLRKALLDPQERRFKHAGELAEALRKVSLA